MIPMLIRYPIFLRFWIASSASLLASRMHSLIIIWLVYKISGSTLSVGIVMIASSLPSVLISPLAGAYIDRYNKVVLMYLADFFRMSIVLLFAYLYSKDMLNIDVIIAGTIFIAISSSFFNPASMSLLPSLVDRDDITKTNAILQMSGSASAIIGPLFGSAIIAFLGAINAFLIAGAFFFISVAFLFGIKDSTKEKKKVKVSILKDMGEGFRLIKKYAIVDKMILKMAIINFFFASLTIIAPALAHGNASGIAWLMSSLGGGMLFSSLLFSSVKFDFKPTIFLSFCIVIMGISFLFLGLIVDIYIELIFVFLIGIALNGFNIILIAIYQKSLPKENLGKIMALISAISISLQPISYGVMGMFIEWIGLGNILLISGTVIVLSAISIFRVGELNETY